MDQPLQTNGPMPADKREQDDELWQRKHTDLFGGCWCVGVSFCLRGRICATVCCAKTCSDSLDTFFTSYRNVVGCTGCPYAWDCSTLQSTCNMQATHMQHDTQHDHFTCKFTVNVQDLVFAAPTLVLNGKWRFLPPRPLCLEIDRKILVLYAPCMCIALAGPHKSHT